jgi:hypothetical protein
MVSGFGQYAQALPGTSGGTLHELWLGSPYRTSAGATLSYNIVRTLWMSREGVVPPTCRSAYGRTLPAACVILFGQPAQDLVYIYGLWHVRNVVGEVMIIGTTETFQYFGSDFESHFTTVLLAGIRAVNRATA